jgi:hypothetical protein
MQTDIKKPNQILREAILRGKLKFLISDVDEVSADAISYIAENFDENVRDLEGALRRFISYCVSFNIDFTYDNAILALDAIISNPKSNANSNTKLHIETIKYVIKKGSVTINGISLTIAEVNGNVINVAVIPHTYENTNLKNIKTGDIVNIEVDMIAKYVEKFLLSSDNKSRISLEFLQEHGF